MLKRFVKSKEEAIDIINALGLRREPFFFAVDFDCLQNIVVPLSVVESMGISYSINCQHPNSYKLPFEFDLMPVSFREYKRKFDGVADEIKKGNSYLVNLSVETPITCSLSLQEIYDYSSAKYKLKLSDRIVVFSPESFVRIEENVISTKPMKGTIDASISNAEENILNDPKEKAEHVTVVDLLRNDISIVADNVSVPRFRYIDRVQTNKKTLLQVSSEIRGVIKREYRNSLGSVIYKLLPAGSISGAPKQKTVEIIKKVEDYDRGFFTGVFGVFTGNVLESAVMIRYIEKVGDELYYRSGGGITAQSNLEKEYQEMIDKIYVPVY